MNDVAETTDTAVDPDRHSRLRLRDVLSRTKSKWKKERGSQDEPKQDFKLSDDVNDFLAAGRKPLATVTTRPVAADPQRRNSSPRPSAAAATTTTIATASLNVYNNNNAGSRDPSPRGVRVPKLDISQSQRWPNSRPVDVDPRSRSHDLLVPTPERQQYNRSHSFNSALAKKGSKPRGLSVTFVNAPPVVIGEGGDQAEAPPAEISRARHQRSRSLSPYLERPPSNQSTGSNSRSPRRKPVPPPSPPAPVQRSEREDSIFQPRPMRRVQTGFNEQAIETPYQDNGLEKQLNDALMLGKELDLSNPFRDPGAQQANIPSPQQSRPPIATNSLITNRNMVASPQQLNFHAQSPRSPDLQQSLETSNKPPPPRVPNFYAEFKRQSHGQSIGNDKETFVHHIQETVDQLNTTPKQNFLTQLKQSLAERAESPPPRTLPARESTPGGWI